GLEVDAERGVILRVEARREGAPFSLLEVTDVAFDETFDPDLFVFTPPAGEDLQPINVRDRFRPNIALHEAAEEVPFTVYVPSRVPADWQLQVTLNLGRSRPPTPASVNLWYRSRDAGAQLNMGQAAASTTDAGLATSDGEEV